MSWQPQSGLQNWAASGDTADADVQTDDTGFITVEVLLEEKVRELEEKLDEIAH